MDPIQPPSWSTYDYIDLDGDITMPDYYQPLPEYYQHSPEQSRTLSPMASTKIENEESRDRNPYSEPESIFGYAWSSPSRPTLPAPEPQSRLHQVSPINHGPSTPSPHPQVPPSDHNHLSIMRDRIIATSNEISNMQARVFSRRNDPSFPHPPPSPTRGPREESRLRPMVAPPTLPSNYTTQQRSIPSQDALAGRRAVSEQPIRLPPISSVISPLALNWSGVPPSSRTLPSPQGYITPQYGARNAGNDIEVTRRLTLQVTVPRNGSPPLARLQTDAHLLSNTQSADRADAAAQTDSMDTLPGDPALTFGYSVQPSTTINGRPIAVPVSRKKRIPEVKKMPCAACLEEFELSRLITATCNCKYCNQCLNAIFRAGCSSATNFPPKCHGKALRINVFGGILERDVVERYKQIEAEFSSTRPLYCAAPKCSQFIQESEMIDATSINYGICSLCNQCTCASCKMLLSAHNSKSGRYICPVEPQDITALRNLCQQEEWKQCPSCQLMVEKIDGCDHIECQCGVEFCYQCGSHYSEYDECDCGPMSDDEGREDDEEDEAWPQHRRMLDPMGRPVCTHPDTDLLQGEICHGCLRPPPQGQIQSCIDCALELCDDCLASIRPEMKQVVDD